MTRLYVKRLTVSCSIRINAKTQIGVNQEDTFIEIPDTTELSINTQIFSPIEFIVISLCSIRWCSSHKKNCKAFLLALRFILFIFWAKYVFSSCTVHMA